MIRNLLSRYHPRYVRALVYMMQASEYRIGEYLAWYHRTRNFARVEYRKRLMMSAKAIVLIASAWILVLCFVMFAGFLGAYEAEDGEFGMIAAFIVAPFLLPYALACVLSLVNLAQMPIESRIIAKAKKKLDAHKGFKIAIAGSYGKTSMREILKTVLKEGKFVAAPPGSYNTPLGIASFVESLQGNEEILLFELGEYYPGDIRTLCEFVRPDLGIVTGVNEAHLEKFGTVQNAAATIFEIAEFVGKGDLYVNGESDNLRWDIQSKWVVFDRQGVESGWQVKNAETNLNGIFCEMRRGKDLINVHSRLLGMHMVGPIALAAELATRLGLSADQIQQGISKTMPFSHRLEPKTDAMGVITIDDSYNGNPDGVAAIIAFLGILKDHRRFYVTPGLVEMGDEKVAVHQEIGRQLALAKIENVILIRNSATPFIAEGLEAAGFSGRLLWFDDALEAYAALPSLTVPGDVVLLQNDWPDQYH